MKCIERGILQTYIDGELGIEMKKSVESHIALCAECGEAFRELKANDDFTFDKLNAYKQYYQESTVSQPSHRPADKKSLPKEKGMSHWVQKYKKLITAACLVLVATTCLSVQPIRAAISNALSIFRVENVKGIHISLEDIENIRSKLSQKNPQLEMEKYGSIRMTGGESTAMTLDEAKKATDVAVLLPTLQPESKIQIKETGASSIRFTLHVDNVNTLLKAFGGKKLFPAEADGKTFTAQFSRVITLTFDQDGKKYTLDETASPELIVPEGVDAQDLYQSIVELPILPDNLRNKLRSIEDWRNTLYLPVINSISREVEVKGGKGVLYTQKAYAMLVWYNNGNIYAIQGSTGGDDLLRVAESLR